MKTIKKITTGSPWEDKVGYSRAVQIGDVVEISGTTAEGSDAYQQTVGIISKAKDVLKEFDADLSNVIRTRIYCTDISKWEDIGKAHGEFFGAIKPATAMVEVAKLIDPEIFVEIEFSAVL